jgi:hypothetical protein
MPIAHRIQVARVDEYDLWVWRCRRCLTLCHHETQQEALRVGLVHLSYGCRPRLKQVTR